MPSRAVDDVWQDPDDLPRPARARKSKGPPRRSKYALPEDEPVDDGPRKRRRGPCPPEERLRQNREAQRTYRQRKEKYHCEVEAAHSYYTADSARLRREIERFRQIGLVPPADLRYTVPLQSWLKTPAPEPILERSPSPALIDPSLFHSACQATPPYEVASGPLGSRAGQATTSPRPAFAPAPMIPSFHPMARLFADVSFPSFDPPALLDLPAVPSQLWLGGLNFQPPPAPMPLIPRAPEPTFNLSGPAFSNAAASGTGTMKSDLLMRRQMRTAGMLFDAMRDF